ncbi:MAG: hypothetical protein IPO23_08655 [Flavobacterium sp.]|nr:hypothetical protein [Flavobacterium sp.]
MKDVEKFEKFEDLKNLKNTPQISEKTQEMIDEFIQLLVKNSRDEKNPPRLVKA